MPNWCENHVTVLGPRAVLDDLWTRMVEDRIPNERGDLPDPSLLRTLVPMPACLEGTTSPPREPYSAVQIATEQDHTKLVAMQDANLEYERARALAVAETGVDNWYDWARKTYGVKWSDHATSWERRSRSIVLTTKTPWAPPSMGYQRASAIAGVTIRNHWYEGGSCVRGVQTFVNGECTHDETLAYRGGRGG